jgi:hypothetical protein
MSDHTPEDVLLRRSIPWRVAAGWVVVAILTWRYLVHPVASTYLAASGLPALPPVEPIAWEDVLAIIGLPIGGAFADRMNKED